MSSRKASEPRPRGHPAEGSQTVTGDLVAALRSSWLLSAEAATGTPDLGRFIGARLDELERGGTLDKGSLIGLLDEVADQLGRSGHAELEPELSRRLLRAVFEFLLGVDARRELDNLRAAAALPSVPAPTPALAPSPTSEAPPIRHLSPSGGGEADGATVSIVAAAVDPVAERAANEAAAQVEVLLRRRAFAEAAALLNHHASQGGLPGLGTIALEAGRRCRAAGEARAAGDCYLAAWTANRLDETALWRLAELAMEAQDHDRAISYLDRLAAVLQWRGDVRGVARVYRKMTILAPDRDDIREQLRRLHTTGHQQ